MIQKKKKAEFVLPAKGIMKLFEDSIVHGQREESAIEILKTSIRQTDHDVSKFRSSSFTRFFV